MSSMQVAEEVMKESVAAYLDAPKSANSEILRRLINVIIHRLSIVVNNLVIALEVPNSKNPSKLDILRIRVEEFSISDSSQGSTYTQALEISYSALYNKKEMKTAKIRSFSVELFEIDESEKSEILHLTSTRSPILSIPETTELNLELSTQPFSFKCAVNLEHVNIGLDSAQLGMLASLSTKLNETLSKVAPPAAKPPTSERASTPAQTTPSASPALSADDSDDDDEFDDAEGDGQSDYSDSDADSSDDDNSSAVLVLRKDPAAKPSASAPSVNMRSSELIAASQNETVFGKRENLAVDVSVCVAFLQLAIVPTLQSTSTAENGNGIKSPLPPTSPPLTSSASSFATASSSSPAPASSSPSSSASNADMFTLESLSEPSKLNKSFVLLRFKDLAIKSSQDAGGNSRLRATLNAFAVHENYKIDAVEIANVPENVVLGETATAGYLTYPVIRIHPHSHSKAPRADSPGASSVPWALRMRHAIEHKIPTTDIEVDQISITLPGRLPKLISQIVADLGAAFSTGDADGSAGSSSDPSRSTPPPGEASAFAGADPSQANPSSKLEQSADKRRLAGLVDSSSSSEHDRLNSLTASNASVPSNGPASPAPAAAPQLETISEDEREVGEEAPPPTKRTLKIGHVFVSLRVPIATANRYSFPVYRKEFIAAYIKRPIATLYSNNSSAPATSAPSGSLSSTTSNGTNGPVRRSAVLPNDTIEFETLSLYLLNNVKDITILARNSESSKRNSGSDSSGSAGSGAPKWFLKFTASSSNDIRTEAVSIQRRPTSSSIPLAAHANPVTLDESHHMMPPLGPSMTVLTEYSGASATYMNDHSARSSSAEGDMGASSVPKFVQQSFESAPFSSVTARFEGETQVPSSMDDESYHAFLTRVMAHSDLAVTVSVHELELELEKSQADLIQDLIDAMGASSDDMPEDLSSLSGRSEEEIEVEKAAKEHEKMSQANAAAAVAAATGALFSGFALELRVTFASIRLTTPASPAVPADKVEYRFSNVETIRVLFVSQYLHTAKTFIIAQVGALRLPSSDALPNTPPILSKIPEFGYEEAKVLTVVLSTEALASYWKKRSRPGYHSKLRQSSASPSNTDVEDDDLASRTIILVEPNRLAIEYRLGERWIGDLGGFFVRDLPVDLSRPKSEVQLFVHARSSSVALRGNIATAVTEAMKRGESGMSNVADPVALLHLEKLVVTSRFVTPSDPLLNSSLSFNFRAHMAQLFIIDDKGRVWLKPSEGAHVKTLRQYWIARGYTPCGFIESLFTKITLNSLSLPKLSIDVNLNATLDITGDQLFAVTQLVSSLSSTSPESLAASAEEKPAIKNTSSPKKLEAPMSDLAATTSDLPTSSSASDLRSAASSAPMRSASSSAIHPSDSIHNGLIPMEDDDEEEEEIIFQGSASTVVQPSSSAPIEQDAPHMGEEFVLVRMTPAQQQAHQRETEKEEWLKTFKLSQHPPPMAPVAKFTNKALSRMPKIIENYKPAKAEEQPPAFSFVFSLGSSEFIVRLREGVSLLEEEDIVTATPAATPAASTDASAKPTVGTRREHRDVLSGDPAPHVAVHLRGFRVTFTNDDLDQSETKLMVKKFFFKNSRDGPTARPFVDFDRGALSSATHMMTLTLASMRNLGDDSAGLHPKRRIHSGMVASKSQNGFDETSSKAPSSADSTNASDSEMSSILIFTLLPLAVRVDIDALEFMRTFYANFAATQPALAAHMAAATGSASETRSGSASSMSRQRSGSSSKMTSASSATKPRRALTAPASPPKQPGPHFHRVSISAISLNLNVSAWAIRMDDAVIQLPSLYCRGVEGWDGVGAELSSAYQPLLYSSLFTFAGSLPVVRLVLSVLGSVSNLVISPYEEYQRGRSPASGAYGAITVGATSVASELLRFGAWVSSTAGDGLQFLESFWRRPDTSKTAAPTNLQQGAQLGYSNMVRQVAAARDCLVVMPWKEYKRHQSVVGLVAGVASAVPLAILKPVIGATHGISNVMQGASNAIHVPGRAKDYARGEHAAPTPSAPSQANPL